MIVSEWSGKKEQKAKTNLLMTQQPIVIIKTTSTTTAPPIAAPIIIVLSLAFVVVDVGCTNWRTVITSELSEFLIILVDPSTPPIIDSVLVNLSGSSGLVGYNTVYKTCTSPVPSSFGKPSTMMIWSLVNTRGLDLRFLNNQLQKQSFTDILQIRHYWKFRNIHRKNPATLLKRDSNPVFFLWILQNF